MAQTVKRLPTMRETWVRSRVWKIPWKRKWQPTPVLLPRKLHGWRSLVGDSPWGHKESDTTEQRFTFRHKIYFCIILAVTYIDPSIYSMCMISVCVCVCVCIFFFPGHIAQHMGSKFSDQKLNPICAPCSVSLES